MTSKKAAIYLLRKKTGMTNAQICVIFNMTSAAVSMVAAGFAKEIAVDNKLTAEIKNINCSFEV